MKNIISPNEKKIITPDLILDTVCDHFHIKKEDIKGSKRNAEIVQPRQIIMYLCREMTQTNFKEIGNILGGRDHSTIIHGCKNIESELEYNENLKNIMETLIKKLNP